MSSFHVGQLWDVKTPPKNEKFINYEIDQHAGRKRTETGHKCPRPFSVRMELLAVGGFNRMERELNQSVLPDPTNLLCLDSSALTGGSEFPVQRRHAYAQQFSGFVFVTIHRINSPFDIDDFLLMDEIFQGNR